jgi:hypothetical protein
MTVAALVQSGAPARKPHLQPLDFYPPEGLGLGREDSKLCAFIEAPCRHLQYHKHQSSCAEHIRRRSTVLS